MLSTSGLCRNHNMKPTHRLKVLNKATGKKGIVGAGWQNPDKSITIVLDPFVALKPSPEWVFTLFPVEKQD